jgi:hypothetical protein
MNVSNPETVIIHVGTSDLTTTRNLDFIMGEVYALVATAKSRFPNCRLVLSGVLRRRDTSWALNERLDWVANTLGVTFVDPNSCIEDGDFTRDGLHLNDGRGDDWENYMPESVDWMSEHRQGATSDYIWKTEFTERRKPEERGDQRSLN